MVNGELVNLTQNLGAANSTSQVPQKGFCIYLVGFYCLLSKGHFASFSSFNCFIATAPSILPFFFRKFEKSEPITSSWSWQSLHPDHLGAFQHTHPTEPMSSGELHRLTSHTSSRTQGGRIVDSNAQPN